LGQVRKECKFDRGEKRVVTCVASKEAKALESSL